MDAYMMTLNGGAFDMPERMIFVLLLTRCIIIV